MALHRNPKKILADRARVIRSTFNVAIRAGVVTQDNLRGFFAWAKGRSEYSILHRIAMGTVKI